MEIITGGRQSGKTTELIKRARANNAVIVVANMDRKLYLDSIIKRMGLDVKTTVMNNLRGFYSDTIFYVDDADHILQTILGLNISGMTITKDDFTDLDYECNCKCNCGNDSGVVNFYGDININICD